MQAATLCFTAPLPFKSTKNLVPRRSTKPHKTLTYRRVIACTAPDTSTVDYSSSTSVFPAEACDTIGGEACDAQIFPEAKLEAPASSTKARAASEEVDREYVQYDEPKTVFPDEACDDLGGEFCEPEYQKGVYKEKAISK